LEPCWFVYFVVSPESEQDLNQPNIVKKWNGIEMAGWFVAALVRIRLLFLHRVNYCTVEHTITSPDLFTFP